MSIELWFQRFRMTICIICLSTISITTQGQIGDNEKLEKLLDKISNQEFLFSDLDLNGKSKRIANQLFKIASEDELIQISKMECKLCFSYSFWVLSKMKSKLVNKIYQDYLKVESQNFVQINKFGNHKGCLKIILTEENFIYEIHENNEYLNEIK